MEPTRERILFASMTLFSEKGYLSTSVADIVLWGLATLVLQLLAFRIVDLVLTGLPQRIQEGEISAAVLLVAAKLATALILAAALTG